MSGSGESRIDAGEIAQSTMKGSVMESALASALNNPVPKKTPKKKTGGGDEKDNG